MGFNANDPMKSVVISEKLGDITVVTLSRPEVRNAVDSTTARALYDAFVAFDEDASARVAVFHGEHGHFCAGWDLQAGARMAQQGTGPGVLTDLDFDPVDTRALGPMGPTRLMLSKPVIAAVSGAAVAGGMELALWCDLRVMEATAYFGVFCRRFGVPLIDGGTVRLPRLVGMGHAMDLILTGRKVELILDGGSLTLTCMTNLATAYRNDGQLDDRNGGRYIGRQGFRAGFRYARRWQRRNRSARRRRRWLNDIADTAARKTRPFSSSCRFSCQRSREV